MQVTTQTDESAPAPIHISLNSAATAPRRWSHLQQRVSMLQEPSGHGVPGLVIRHRLLLLWLQDLSLLLQACRQRRCMKSSCRQRHAPTFERSHSPPMTLSMACSKCFWLIASERWRAAIRAASLQTLAMSAPDWRRAGRTKVCLGPSGCTKSEASFSSAYLKIQV